MLSNYSMSSRNQKLIRKYTSIYSLVTTNTPAILLVTENVTRNFLHFESFNALIETSQYIFST